MKLSAKPRSVLIIFGNLFVLVVATWAYFYNSKNAPVGYHLDSLVDVMNAFCIRFTGADDWGIAHPWYLRGFNDFRPVIMTYLFMLMSYVVPLGLYPARVLSMFLGFAGVGLTFLFLIKLKILEKPRIFLAYSLMFVFLLLSSWIMLPHRIPIEFAGVLFFEIFLIGTSWWVIKKPTSTAAGISNGIFVASMLYLYYGTKPLFFMAIPVLIFFFVLERRRNFQRIESGKVRFFSWNLLKNNRALFVSLLVAFALALPTLLDLLGPAVTTSRFGVIGNKNPEIFVRNYFTHLSPNFLFFNGDRNPRHSTGYKGELNQFFLPLYLVGLAALFIEIFRRKNLLWAFIGTYYFMCLIPVAITDEGIPHSIRTLMAIIPLIFILLLGYQRIESFVFSGRDMEKKIKVVLLLILFGFGISEARTNFEIYHNYLASRIEPWDYEDGKYVLPAEKVPMNHDPQTLRERYTRAIYEGDLSYCAGKSNAK